MYVIKKIKLTPKGERKMLKNRLLSVILVLALVLSTAITVAPNAAADVEETYNVTSYGEIEAILEEDGDAKIILDADIEEIFSSNEWDTDTSEITLGEGNKILDLNGHNLYVKDEVNKEDQGATCRKPTLNLFCIPENAYLQVTDENPNVLTDRGSIQFDAYMIGYSTNPITLSFDPGHFTCVAVRNIFLVEAGGELVIDNGYFECGREKAQHLTEANRTSFASYEPGVNDTAFTDCITYRGDDNYKLWHSHDAWQVVFGAPIVVDGGKVTVNDGDFLARGCSRSNILCNWSLYMLNKSNIGDFCRAGIMITGKNSKVDINGGFFHGTDGAQALFISEKIRDTITLDIYAGTFITTQGVDYIRCTEALAPTRKYAKMFRAYTYIPTQYIRGQVEEANEDLVILDNIFARGISAYTSNLMVVPCPKITTQSTNESCVVGDTLTLTVKAENATTYTWQQYDEMGNKVGSAYTGKKDGTFQVSSDMEGTYIYKCTLTGKYNGKTTTTVSEPITVTFTPESKNYGVWVKGRQLTTEDHGNLATDGYTYDAEEKMLILENFTDTNAYMVKTGIYSTIYSENGALNITLNGKNSISAMTTAYYGLYAAGNINLFGDGSLTITPDSNKASAPFTGIYSGGQVKFWDAPDVFIDGSICTTSFTGISADEDVWFDGDGQTRITCSTKLGETNNVAVAVKGGTELKKDGVGVIRYAYGHLAMSANGKAFRPFKGYTEFDELRWFDIKVDGETVDRKSDTTISHALNNTVKVGVDINFCEYYDISVGGVEVSDFKVYGKCENGGYWSYDTNNNVLYLNDAQISGCTITSESYKTAYGIYTELDDLDICVNGDCSIDFSDITATEIICGIKSKGNLNFLGTGNLKITSSAKATFMYTGIDCDGLMKIDRDGDINIDFSDKTSTSCIGLMYTSKVSGTETNPVYETGLLCESGNLIINVGKGNALRDWGSNGDKFLKDGRMWLFGDSATTAEKTNDTAEAYTGISSGCKYIAMMENDVIDEILIKMAQLPLEGETKIKGGSENITQVYPEGITVTSANASDGYCWKGEDSKSTYTADVSYYTLLKVISDKTLEQDNMIFNINGAECNAVLTAKDTATNTYTYKITCTCKPVAEGSKTAITDENVTLSATSYTYTGAAKKPTVKVVDKYGTVLTEGTDYTLTYSGDCKKAGTYTVTVNCAGEYEGTVSKSFTVKAQTLTSAKTTLSATSYTWNGSAKKPTVTVKNSSGTVLKSGTDYTVKYCCDGGCKTAGTHTVTVSGKTNYKGTVTKTFTISKPAIVSANVSLSATSYKYTGATKKPTVTVKNASGTTLKNGTDYKVTYCCSKGCKKAGTHTVTVTGIGNYTGTVKKTFTIKTQALVSSRITLSKTSFTYTGSAKKPTVTVKDYSGNILTKGTDYTVTYSTGCKKVGTYTVTITGKGNYSGSVKKTFKITAQELKASRITLSKTSFSYTGKTIKPSVTVKDYNGKVLTSGTDYKISYDCSKGCKKKGTHKITITGIGNYSGTVTKTFTIK